MGVVTIGVGVNRIRGGGGGGRGVPAGVGLNSTLILRYCTAPGRDICVS